MPLEAQAVIFQENAQDWKEFKKVSKLIDFQLTDCNVVRRETMKAVVDRGESQWGC